MKTTENMKPTTEILKTLLSEVAESYAESKRKEQARWDRGESFNIFNTVGLKSEEVRLHSAFIGELLNPNGSHGASSLFLKAFLEVIGIDRDYINCEACSANILERVIGTVTKTEGGRIDIIIEDGSHAVIIENKIYASDQCNQLLRYHNYGKKHFPNGYELLYLTLDGHDPSDCSMGNKKFDHKAISYDSEILEWLDKCYESVSNDMPVREIIRQYSELVKQLTYKDMDTKYLEDLKVIALAPENVLAVGELFRIQGEWFDALIDAYVWKSLAEYATSKGVQFVSEGGRAYLYREEWKYYAIFIENDRRNDWNEMYVGIRSYNEPNAKNKIFIKDYTAMNCLKCAPENKYPYPYGWEYLPDPILNWNYDLTEEIVNGKVCNWLKSKLEEILDELQQRNLPMP